MDFGGSSSDEEDEESSDFDNMKQGDQASSGAAEEGDEGEEFVSMPQNSPKDVVSGNRNRPNTAPVNNANEKFNESPRPISAAANMQPPPLQQQQQQKGKDLAQIPPISPRSLKELIFHPSDSFVKPIVMNHRIEKTMEAKFDPK